jgi:hypothetical protein
VLNQQTGRLRDAADLFRRAAGSFRRALGAGHPHTQLAKNNLKNIAVRLKGEPMTRR